MRFPIQVAGLVLSITGAGSIAAAAPSLASRSPQTVAVAGAHGPALRSRGLSCSGSPSFIGIDPSGTPNFAGTGSGVAAGYSNSACDLNDFIGAGLTNQIGGNGASPYASIIAGQNNSVGNAPNAFMGGGQSNAVYGASYSPATDSTIVGGESNVVGVSESAIAAGSGNQINAGTNDFIGAGESGTIRGAQSGIIAGIGNVVGSDYSFVGAGKYNQVQGGYADAVVAGAYNTAGSTLSFIGAGESNQTSGTASAIGAGYSNKVTAYGGFIGAGYTNSISGIDAFVGAGRSNAASGAQAFIGAGESNVAAGTFSMIPGGYQNHALGYASFAGGVRAFAGHNGTFVWADDAGLGSSYLQSSGANQFIVRSTGGVFFYSNAQLTCGVVLKPGSSVWTPIGSNCGMGSARRSAGSSAGASEESDVAQLRAEHRALAERVARLERDMAALTARATAR